MAVRRTRGTAVVDRLRVEARTQEILVGEPLPGLGHRIPARLVIEGVRDLTIHQNVDPLDVSVNDSRGAREYLMPRAVDVRVEAEAMQLRVEYAPTIAELDFGFSYEAANKPRTE